MSAAFDATLRRCALAADLHHLGLATASEAVGRDLAVLAPSIVRELRAASHHDLAARVIRWECDVTAAAVAALTAVSL